MQIRRVFVQGAGTMGNGIAQVSAQAEILKVQFILHWDLFST